MSSNESRSATRLRHDSRLLIQVGGRTYPGCLEDVSLRGALVTLDAPAGGVVGKACRMEVQDANGASDITLNGIVVHGNAMGTRLGVKFVAVGNSASSALWQLVSGEAAMADAMDRDWSALIESEAGAAA